MVFSLPLFFPFAVAFATLAASEAYGETFRNLRDLAPQLQ
jgi:hypothetical protein